MAAAPPPAARPAGLEFKTAALAGTVATATAAPADTGVWEGIVAVTGVPLPSGVIYAPGAIGRSLRNRTPKGTHGRSWLRPVAQVLAAYELPPGDPRLPVDWPPGAGAVWARLKFITGTTDGRAALAAAQAAGPGEWALGFQAQRESKRAGTRVIDALDLFQLCPRGLVDTHAGPGPEVKAAGVRLEFKAGGPAQRSFRDRPGLPRLERCSVCKLPAAALVGGGLRPNESLVCADCVRVMHEALDEHVAAISPEELAEAGEVTSEEAFEQALADEQVWDLEPDGLLVEATDDPARGRAWGRDTPRAWGRP